MLRGHAAAPPKRNGGAPVRAALRGPRGRAGRPDPWTGWWPRRCGRRTSPARAAARWPAAAAARSLQVRHLGRRTRRRRRRCAQRAPRCRRAARPRWRWPRSAPGRAGRGGIRLVVGAAESTNTSCVDLYTPGGAPPFRRSARARRGVRRVEAGDPPRVPASPVRVRVTLGCHPPGSMRSHSCHPPTSWTSTAAPVGP